MKLSRLFPGSRSMVELLHLQHLHIRDKKISIEILFTATEKRRQNNNDEGKQLQLLFLFHHRGKSVNHSGDAKWR